MSEYPEQDVEEEGASLSEQLGTSGLILGKGRIDMRILTILTKRKNLPDTMKSTLYMLIKNDVVNNGKTFSEAANDNLLHLLVSVEGKGRRQLIQAEQVRKGGSVSFESEFERPGWLARNTWNRNWEEKERERLGLNE